MFVVFILINYVIVGLVDWSEVLLFFFEVVWVL